MNNISLFFIIVSLSSTIPLIFPHIAHAYLDAGTGSYILQLIIGVFLGGLFFLKMFWQKIKNLFIKSNPGDDQENTTHPR